MDDQDKLWEYANNFKRLLSEHLKPGVGVSADIYPARKPGAVLEFFLYDKKPIQAVAEVTKGTKDSVNEILKSVEGQPFSDNLDATQFSGTSMYLQPNKILLVKGDDSTDEWDNVAASRDVNNVLKTAKSKK